MQQFSGWILYNHSELAFIDGKYVPIPVNIDTVNTLFNLNPPKRWMLGWRENKFNTTIGNLPMWKKRFYRWFVVAYITSFTSPS
jgi:UDP-galactopyranose mutase